MYKNKVTEQEFVTEMLVKGNPNNNFTEEGLACLFRHLEEANEATLFDADYINREFFQYKGLKDFNDRYDTTYCSVSRIPCVIEVASMDGFFQN